MAAFERLKEILREFFVHEHLLVGGVAKRSIGIVFRITYS
jgi:hypothetical protein